ncbi:acyl-CoA carboxylase subunit beta [Rhodococcoides yunnanense]|uniref:acyl-CoA carboxylase subunit beta n=1 Tax=Rhodococcoides yunnanense TaxID=278209 RepID=UPI000934A6A9|nr:carboxyl transferase domain-containing protein [Rhodococcus yunnanensis]
MTANDWTEVIAGARTAQAAVLDSARPEAVQKQRGRDMLTARERIAVLADEGSFMESGALVTPSPETVHHTGDRPVPADAVITGRCLVDGRPVHVMSMDFTVLGGSIGTVGSLKIDKLVERSLTLGIPLVMLLEGGGHRIQEGLDARHFAIGAPLFRIFTKLSGWVPITAAVLGPGFAGASNYSAMADFVVMRRGTSQMGIAGPALVAAATGEITDAEKLGGAAVQADKNGIADLAVDSDEEAVNAMKEYLAFLPTNAQAEPQNRTHNETEADEPVDMTDIVPISTRKAYDVHKVIAAIVDDQEYFAIKPGYARNLVTALARIGGRPVGIIANQPKVMAGALDSAACEKGAHFVSLCDAFGIALVYLIDVPGFLVGSPAEATGLARRSGRLVFELGQATVPRCSIVLRKGYGLAYVAMCGGRSFDADLAVAWPSAEISAMSVEGAVDVMFKKDFNSADDPDARRAELIAGFKSQLGGVYGAGGYGIDNVIEPSETRANLLAVLRDAPLRRIEINPPRVHAISPI